MTQTISLATLLEGLVSAPVPDVKISAIALDSREVKAGALFLAVPGTQTRGHDFIAHAIEAGASAIVYEPLIGVAALDCNVPCLALPNLSQQLGLIADRFYAHPSRDLFVVGITGTNGKTSCCHFLAQALDTKQTPCAVVGTLGNGLWGQLDAASHTTPDAISLHRYLRAFAKARAHSVVMEASSHGLHQSRVEGIAFDVAVLTNLSRDHLDYHADMAAYAKAKAKLFAMPGLRYAVINADDAFGRQLMAANEVVAEQVAYGLDLDISVLPAQTRWVAGHLLSTDQNGFSLKVATSWGTGVIRSGLLGRFNASNVLAVLAVLLLRGLAFDEALDRLSQLKTAPGRMEHYGGEGQCLVVIDYAHTPDALQHVLATLRTHCEGRLWVVFGCGGDRDPGKRPMMGEVAERFADERVITDDNPRFEAGDAIVQDIQKGMNSPARVIRDRAKAIAYAINHAAANDVVLVAGKGDEIYQQINGKKHPFSDRAQVQYQLRRRAS